MLLVPSRAGRLPGELAARQGVSRPPAPRGSRRAAPSRRRTVLLQLRPPLNSAVRAPPAASRLPGPIMGAAGALKLPATPPLGPRPERPGTLRTLLGHSQRGRRWGRCRRLVPGVLLFPSCIWGTPGAPPRWLCLCSRSLPQPPGSCQFL